MKWDIDFESIKPHIIHAFTKVYGEEYHSIIEERINKAFIFYYSNYDDLTSYINYVCHCKKRELSIEFLKQIGIEVKTDNNNYSESFDKDTHEIIDCLIDSYFLFDSNVGYVPLYAFSKTNKSSPEKLLNNKLKIINFFLKNSNTIIDENNILSFMETEEFREILKKINEYQKIYEKLFEKYKDWTQQFKAYEDFFYKEREREIEIQERKENELLDEIIDKLPESSKKLLLKNNRREQKTSIIDLLGLEFSTHIESFKRENIDKLKSSDLSNLSKKYLICFQMDYLKGLGIKCPRIENLENYNDDIINDYLSFLDSDGVKEYIPSEDFISFVENARERKFEESKKEFIITGEDFKLASKGFSQKENTINYLYECVKRKKICIAGQGAYSNDVFHSLIFYTIRGYIAGGVLSYYLIHEYGHVIDQASSLGSGFDIIDNRKNPYNSESRKYEKFNETLNDIYSIEARNILHSEGIYLIEPKEITILDVSDYNTHSITKEVLRPLLKKHRKEITESKINTNPQILMDSIGEDNYEELVDTVNKVDYLTRNGLSIEMVNSYPNNTMVLEYLEQVERAKQIYNNIDDYYENKFGNTKKRIRDNKKAIK